MSALRLPATVNEWGRPTGIRLVDLGEGRGRIDGQPGYTGSIVIGRSGSPERWNRDMEKRRESNAKRGTTRADREASKAA